MDCPHTRDLTHNHLHTSRHIQLIRCPHTRDYLLHHLSLKKLYHYRKNKHIQEKKATILPSTYLAQHYRDKHTQLQTLWIRIISSLFQVSLGPWSVWSIFGEELLEGLELLEQVQVQVQELVLVLESAVHLNPRNTNQEQSLLHVRLERTMTFSEHCKSVHLRACISRFQGPFPPIKVGIWDKIILEMTEA